jgi:uncharacterized protein YndB with AHSA1/START domain
MTTKRVTRKQAADGGSGLPAGIGAPATRALTAAGYTTLEQLGRADEAELLRLHGMGPKAMGRIRDALREAGLGSPDNGASSARASDAKQAELPHPAPPGAGPRVSSEAVREATGRGWEEWQATLDAAGAAEWSHKEIVAYLEREHPEVASGWWRQSVTVGYEYARGSRVVGQTADTGFQVGVQKRVPLTVAEAWERITSRPELWLGEGASVAFDAGERYRVPSAHGEPGASGEVRVVRPGNRLRMTWQPEGWPSPATLQLTVTEAGSGKTSIGAHLEKLPDAEAREAMRARWRAALDRIAATVGK